MVLCKSNPVILDLSYQPHPRSSRQPTETSASVLSIVVSYASFPYPCTDLFKFTTRHIVWLPVAQLCRDDTPFGKVRRFSFQRASVNLFKTSSYFRRFGGLTSARSGCKMFLSQNFLHRAPKRFLPTRDYCLSNPDSPGIGGRLHRPPFR